MLTGSSGIYYTQTIVSAKANNKTKTYAYLGDSHWYASGKILNLRVISKEPYFLC